MIRGTLSAYSKKEAALVAFRISKLRVKKFRTLETDGELSYVSPALW